MTVRTALVVAPSPVPLRSGGAERHWDGLRRSLEDAGVATDLVKLPVRERTLLDLLDAYEAFRLLDVSHADVVVTGKYPAWMVQHPNHVVWMLHPLRGLYDTWSPARHEADDPARHGELAGVLGALDDRVHAGDPLELIDQVRSAADALGPDSSLADGPFGIPGTLARRVVHHLDRWALDPRRVRRHMAISSVVAGRAGYFPAGVDPEVLIPPSCLGEPEPVEVPTTRDYLAVGRLESPKRIDLAIRAFALLEDPAASLTVAGDGSERSRLEDIAADDRRVRFVGRVPDAELAALYRDARAVLVTPAAEDFGYVAIEALQAGRCVVTTTDSGGPAELVTDGHDGLVVAPSPRALADALASLDDDTASRLGTAGRCTAASHSWAEAARNLLEPVSPRTARPGRRGRIAALSTYPVDRWPGGGPERAGHLLGALADCGWDVELVAIAPEGTQGQGEVADGFTEVRAPLSERHRQADRRLRRLTANLAVGDITASVLWPASGELVGAAGRVLHGADLVVAVQPYLAPMARRLAPAVPLVYDAHNHERTLKAAMLPDDEAGRWMLERVADAERIATTDAELVVATTTADAHLLEHDHDLARGSVLVVPNGVDAGSTTPATAQTRTAARRSVLDRFAPGSGPGPDTIALFVGSAHRPNVDAAHEIVRIAANRPDILFLLAGEHSDMVDSRHLPGNVACLGRVEPDELDRLHAAADVALNPMRSGSGSNLKVLEYLAAGIPVVSTQVGVRGLPEAHRYLTAVRFDEFDSALAEVASGSLGDRDSGELAARAAAAREMVVATHDWQVVSADFTAAVREMVDAGARR